LAIFLGLNPYVLGKIHTISCSKPPFFLVKEAFIFLKSTWFLDEHRFFPVNSSLSVVDPAPGRWLDGRCCSAPQVPPALALPIGLSAWQLGAGLRSEPKGMIFSGARGR